MRLTLVCTSAARLPMNMVRTAETQMAQNQRSRGAERHVENAQHQRERRAFGAEASSAVTGVGAPS